MSRNVNRVAAVVTAGALAVGGATAGYLGRGAADESSSQAPTRSAAATSTAQPAAAQSTLSVAQLYRNVRNGVVEVIASEQAADSPFPGGGSGEATAQGSGFVYDS